MCKLDKFSHVDMIPDPENIDFIALFKSEERKENIKCTNPCCAAVCGFFKRLWRFITKDRDLTPRQKICIIAVVISSIAAIVFLGLFPSSFVYLDYHEVRTFTCRAFSKL